MRLLCQFAIARVLLVRNDKIALLRASQLLAMTFSLWREGLKKICASVAKNKKPHSKSGVSITKLNLAYASKGTTETNDLLSPFF